MLKPRLIPVLLLRDWGLEKSVRFHEYIYVGSPVNAARMFSDFSADELVVLDIAARRAGRGPSTEVLGHMAAEMRMPLCAGGGIRHEQDVENLLAAGIDRVVLNSEALARPDLITQLASRFGSQCIVLSIDVRRSAAGKYEVYSHGGRQPTGRDPRAWAHEAAERGAGEVLLTSIDRDGTYTGFDLPLVGQCAAGLTIPLIAGGGAGSLADVAAVLAPGYAQSAACAALFVLWGPRHTVLVNYPTQAELAAQLPALQVRQRLADRPLTAPSK